LISILLPALGRARESAKTVQCASNMRQIGLAMRMYSNDNKGVVPPGNDFAAGAEYGTTSASPPYAYWNFLDLMWIQGYVKHTPRETVPTPAGSTIPIGTFGVMYPSIERGIYSCPSETRTSGIAAPWNFAHHYKMNVEAAPEMKFTDGTPTSGRGDTSPNPPYYGYFRYPHWIKWTYLKSDKILLAESYSPGTVDSVIFKPAGTDGITPKDVTLRHGSTTTLNRDGKNGANYMFPDGHVEYSIEYHRARNSGGPQTSLDNFSRWWNHGQLMTVNDF
jgi:prepilin-type processing-associated H-X9-DG protein